MLQLQAELQTLQFHYHFAPSHSACDSHACILSVVNRSIRRGNDHMLSSERGARVGEIPRPKAGAEDKQNADDRRDGQLEKEEK